jgi:hypothetical protein
VSGIVIGVFGCRFGLCAVRRRADRRTAASPKPRSGWALSRNRTELA